MFPRRCKNTIVRPLLMKCTMDLNDPALYRPISNLGFLSKVVEKVVDSRLSEHISKHHFVASGSPVSLPPAPFGEDGCGQRT